MSRLSFVFSCVIVSAVADWLGGCDSPDDAKSNGAHDDHAGHPHDGEIEQNLAKLSAEDRQAAEKQKNCPVTDEPLGSMGKPMIVDVQGRSVFICCESCRDELLKNSTKYLAKLKD